MGERVDGMPNMTLEPIDLNVAISHARRALAAQR
jgi:hypothetical protein